MIPWSPLPSVSRGAVRNDGGGFPGDLSGNDIPIGARIIRLLNDIQRDPAPTLLERYVSVIQQNPGAYDPTVVDAAMMSFASGTGGMSAPVLNRQPRQIGFPELRSGHVLRSRIHLQDGTVVAAANQVVSATLLERLNNYALLGLIREPIAIE